MKDNKQKIKIEKRIRDISYNKKNNFFTLALENDKPSIGIIIPKKN